MSFAAAMISKPNRRSRARHHTCVTSAVALAVPSKVPSRCPSGFPVQPFSHAPLPAAPNSFPFQSAAFVRYPGFDDGVARAPTESNSSRCHALWH